jgi:energy-coupling factor transporter ATP-binding protein EcfA2
MITLERIRLVRWHYFADELIDIGNRCLFAGDNGSGKSTIVDAIQYAMAADLRKTRFNAAAGDRRSGRDLAGYVRCKIGSDATEYLRNDAVAHVMLEFSGGAAASDSAGGKTAGFFVPQGFSAGVCVEAFADGRLTERFWIGDNIPIDTVAVGDEKGELLTFRQFRDSMPGRSVQGRGLTFFDSKSLYLKDFTNRLGVWRRLVEYNPYLEAFTRSVSFTPLISVDKFVCDYILDDRPVEISIMKANLESYKEADREAKAAILRIKALKKITAKAAEWRSKNGLILKQEYLMMVIEKNTGEKRKAELERKQVELEGKLEFLEKEIAALKSNRFELDHERQETETALALNDAHNLYRRIAEKLDRIKAELAEETGKAEKYRLYRSQCEALLGRSLEENPETGMALAEAGEKEKREEKDEARRRKEELGFQLQDALTELAELEKGIPRYPESPTLLRRALEEAGITAHFLADLAEVTDPAWTDAAEGWLNTLRFAVLVQPGQFQKALEIYDRLPRSVAGAFLPNLEKMREAKARENSLAKLIKTDSVYARMYVDYTLGDVICADIGTLKNYMRSVTRECMTYSNHTASRIREEVYRRHYLGRSSRKERQEFLLAESVRLRGERDRAAEKEERAAGEEGLFRRAYRTLVNMGVLFPSIQKCKDLETEKAQTEADLAAIDTSGFEELQNRRAVLLARIGETEERLQRRHQELGKTGEGAEENKAKLAGAAAYLETREQSLRVFGGEHPAELADCEAYAEEKLRKTGITELLNTYDSTLKGFRSRTESLQREYQNLVQTYDRDFNALISLHPRDSAEADKLLNRLEMSELPEYQEKIEKARRDAEREFKDHFIAVLNERIESTRESFREINDTLKVLSFGRDQYRFALEERHDRRGQIEIIKKAAGIPSPEDSLFAQLTDPGELKAAQDLFERILAANLDSPELRSICDYRTYFHYDIKIRDTESVEETTGKPVELSLSKVIREKSGGEAQTPYYVAIAASFYRFFKDKPDKTVRLVMFDEAFNRMDDERIGKILEFYRHLGIQLISSVPTEKIEAMVPYMDRINLVIRHDRSAFVRDFHRQESVEV